jgi:hypothetical protein
VTEESVRKATPRPEKPKGTVGRTLSWIFGLAGALLVAILISVVIELVGIAARWWPGSHAATLLITERRYIEAIDRFPLMALSPTMVASTAESRFDQATATVRRSATHAGRNDSFAVYLLAAINITKLVLLRLVVCLFSLPGYLIVAIAALIDGIVQRDIRKFTGGHESSYVFHKAKRWVVPAIVGTVSLYLMMPWSLYPALVFAPSMALFGFMLYVAASRFKKFL